MKCDDELLVITMEECSELVQACSKILRFGRTEKSVQNLKRELGDVACMLALFVEYDWMTEEELIECMGKKAKKLKKWSSLPIDLNR